MKKLVMLATNMLLAAILMAPLQSSVNAATQTTVDINNASADELKSVKGIGDATAKKIIAGRPYSSVDDLAKAGVSKRTITKIRSQVTVGSSSTASVPSTKSAPPATSSPTPAARSASSAPGKGMVWANPDSKGMPLRGRPLVREDEEGAVHDRS